MAGFYPPIKFDDRGKRANSLRIALKDAIKTVNKALPQLGDTPYETFLKQVAALNLLKNRGVIDQHHVDFMTAGFRSTYNGLERSRRGLPFEVIKDPQFGFNVIKPVENSEDRNRDRDR